MNTPLFFLTIAVLLGALQLSIHRVDEGHVGVYWRGGALVDRITQPGWHLKVPIVDTFENVQVTMQTDKVTDIPCGTSGGVLLWFERIEVVNRLKEKHVFSTIKNYTVNYDKIWIFDKIHHEINQFCSKHTLQEIYIDLFHTVDDRLQQALQESCDKWAPGIEIISIRVTKPKIPDSILKNYEQMEAEKTRLLVSIEAQKVVQKQAETDKLKATIEAEKQAAVSKIEMTTLVSEEESRKQVQQIQDEAMLNHQKAVVDAETYRLSKIADSNKMLFSPEYLQLELIRSIGNSTKVYFGPSLNSLFLDFVEMMTKSKNVPTTVA